jgi:hypothetical protein
LKTVSDLR